MNTQMTTAPAIPGVSAPGGSRCDRSIQLDKKGTDSMTRQTDIAEPDRSCTPWCRDTTRHNYLDRACWGTDFHVNLTLEEGYPHDAIPGMEHSFDPPRVGANPYRYEPGRQSIVYLHLYRPHENQYLDMDQNLKLTTVEAKQLVSVLLAAVDEIEGATGNEGFSGGPYSVRCAICDAAPGEPCTNGVTQAPMAHLYRFKIAADTGGAA